MTIIADKMVCGGDCITKIDGKTVFVPGLLPGEEASIKIVESRKDFDRAEVLAITEQSPHRRQAPCPYYGSCGGCNLQIADDDYQKELRLSILKDCFKRGLGRSLREEKSVMNVIDAADILAGSSWNYRSRFQFHADGLKKKADESIVAIDDCLIATESVNKILHDKKLPARNGRTHVFEDVIAGENDDESEYEVKINECRLQFNVRGFFQSNLEMTGKTISMIYDILEKHFSDKETEEISPYSKKSASSILLDMYCGVGTFSRFLGPLFDKSVLVEHNAHAIGYAERNISGIPHSAYAMSGAKWVRTPEAKQDYAAVIIDPPRSGMEKEVAAWLCAHKSPVVCSVSCDPVTHARDTAKLIQSGYRLEKLTLLDFYPQTSHIESFALFTSNDYHLQIRPHPVK